MNISKPSKRLFAAFLDAAISCIISIIMAVAVGMPMAFSPALENANEKVYMFAVLSYALYAFLFLNSAFIVQMFFWRKGTSIGKHLLKMTVVDRDSQIPVSFWKMAFRELIVKYVSGLFFGLGFLWILIDSQYHQAWHDKILSTLVVDIQDTSR